VVGWSVTIGSIAVIVIFSVLISKKFLVKRGE